MAPPTKPQSATKTPADADPTSAREAAGSHEDGPKAATPGSAPGPAVIDGPFGTTVDSTDPGLGKLRVEVKSNLSLDNKVITPGQKIEVLDTAEARGALGVGHLRLLDDDEKLDAK